MLIPIIATSSAILSIGLIFFFIKKRKEELQNRLSQLEVLKQQPKVMPITDYPNAAYYEPIVQTVYNRTIEYPKIFKQFTFPCFIPEDTTPRNILEVEQNKPSDQQVSTNLSKPVEQYYPDGVTRFKGQLLNGKPHGSAQSFYANGTLEEEYTYKKGLLSGSFKNLYEHGQLRHEGAYSNDQLHGIITLYKPNGTVSETITFNHGEETGPFQIFDEDGKLKENGALLQGQREGIVTEYTSSGQIKTTTTYIKGVPKGDFAEFEDNNTKP